MTNKNKYIVPVFKGDNSILINTQSPNDKYFYKIQEPKDIYWGLMCSKIAFYNIGNELIYHNENQYCEYRTNNKNEWSIVNYSKSGDLVFFIERNSTKTLYFVILNLLEKTIFRQQYENELENNVMDKKLFDNEFDDEIAIEILKNNSEPINSDKIKFELKNIFGLLSWRP
ncbi:MAG: hypothetical protein HYR91_09900 [Flavobacteriia bacterium]|nr:hypothetical protein [Flavobacteriia bacterium]